MKDRKEFLKHTRKIEDPKIEEKIKSGNPYTICDLLEETKGGVNGMYLKKLEDAIIETNDIVQIYEFMFLAVDLNVNGFDRKRFEQTIIESKNSKLIRYCLAFVPGTNLEEMLKALKAIQNAKDMEIIMTDEEYSEVFEEIKQIEPNYEKAVEKAKEFDYYPESLRQFRNLKDNISQMKEEVKATKNPHLITELANYIEYLNEYKRQAYSIDDLTIAQEEAKDPMQAYEYLSSVNVKNKSGLIQSVKDSGRIKFRYYLYEYVPGLTEGEKSKIKESIIQEDTNGKYKEMLEDKRGEEDICIGN